MNLYLRLFFLLIFSGWRPKLDIMEESKLGLRVFPNDLDIYGHVNNSRYLAIMDLGRMDLLLRSPLGKAASKNGWNPVLGAVSINFKRSLKLFQKFTLCTRILRWDEKWFYIEQRFENTEKRILASAVVKGVFIKNGRRVPVDEVMDKMTGGF